MQQDTESPQTRLVTDPTLAAHVASDASGLAAGERVQGRIKGQAARPRRMMLVQWPMFAAASGFGQFVVRANGLAIKILGGVALLAVVVWGSLWAKRQERTIVVTNRRICVTREDFRASRKVHYERPRSTRFGLRRDVMYTETDALGERIFIHRRYRGTTELLDQLAEHVESGGDEGRTSGPVFGSAYEPNPRHRAAGFDS